MSEFKKFSVQKHHNQQYLWYFCTKIAIKLLKFIKK